MDIKNWTIKRTIGLWSTATGYEVRTVRRGSKPSPRIHVYQVHHFSMRRFYRLSHNDINIRDEKPVDYSTWARS